MAPSPFPSRGIFIPTSMVFNQQLPAAVLVTWIQLRALAWRGWSTPAFSLAEIASILGIHPSRLEKHLDHLQGAGALSLRTSPGGKLVISFPQQPLLVQDERAQPVQPLTPPIPLAQERAMAEPASYFPPQVLGYLTYAEETPPPALPEASDLIHSQLDTHWVKLAPTHSLCSHEAA